MKERKIIPAKPILKNDFSCCIKLKKSQVDSSLVAKLARSQGFREQRFRHITILSSVNYSRIEKSLGKKKVGEIIKKLRIKIKELSWEYEQKEIYLITKKINPSEQRYSYVRLIKMSDINKFFKYLNKLSSLYIPTQYPHVTLFTKGEKGNPDYYGIPIPSEKEFKSLKPIKIV